MDIVSIVVLMLAGLGLLLYGMYMFSHALEACMGQSLGNRFMKVADSPIRSYFFSAIMTFATQKSTMVSGMIMNYVNYGTISLKKSLPFVLGLSFGNAISIILMIFQGLNITRFLSLLCFVGAVINLLFRQEKMHNIAKALVGFGMLFLGIDLVGQYATMLFEMDGIFDFFQKINYPVVIMLLALVFSFITTSNFASLTLLAAFVSAGIVSVDTAVLGMLAVSIGTSLASYVYTVPGQGSEARMVAVGHIIAHLFGVILLLPLYFAGVYTWLFGVLGNNVFMTLIIVHMVQMTLPILLLPLCGVLEKMLRRVVPQKKNSRDSSRAFIIPDTTLETFSTGYLALLNSVKLLLQKNQKINDDILDRMGQGKDMRGISGSIMGLNKAIKISNNAVLRLTSKVGETELHKTNVLVNIFNDIQYLADRSKKLMDMANEIAKKPRGMSAEQVGELQNLLNLINGVVGLVNALCDDVIANKPVDSDALKLVLDANKQIYAVLQKQRRAVYNDYKDRGAYPDNNAYFNALGIFENTNTALENIAIKLGILSG